MSYEVKIYPNRVRFAWRLRLVQLLKRRMRNFLHKNNKNLPIPVFVVV